MDKNEIHALISLLEDPDNDIYFQVGLLTTIGLSVKNAILIEALSFFMIKILKI